MEQTKKSVKVYEPSENLKAILKAIGNNKELSIEQLKVATGKTSNCLIATACSVNNKEYITYHKKYTTENDKQVNARITLTEKGFQYFKSNLENK